MSENTITISDHPRVRQQEIKALLLPLRPRRRDVVREVPVSLAVTLGKNVLIVAARESGGDSDYREWLFKTRRDGFLAQYFEQWESESDAPPWRLAQACFHLFRATSPHEPPEEVFAVHCEPRELGESRKMKYKRGPHVHMKPAGHPLAHAHIPLNYGHLDSVLESLQPLMLAITHALEIADEEVLKAPW